jgi:hypothetical protein
LLSATFVGRSDLKGFRWSRKSTPGQVFTEGGSHHRGQRRRHFLPLAIRRKRSFELVIKVMETRFIRLV